MDKNNVEILLDNGHGSDNLGNRSPDGKVLEYAYARKLVDAISKELKAQGYNVCIVTPETYNVKIGTRVSRINKICRTDKRQHLVVSVHLNASGNGSRWMSGQGWEVLVSLNASTKSKMLADCLYDEAEKVFKVRPASLYQKHKAQNLGICRDTNCPAVLTENLFMDNRDDCAALQTELGFKKIVQIHVDGIKKYIQSL